MSEHVLTVLKAKRAEIAGQVHDTQKKLAKLRAALANLDSAMNILTPDHPDYIPKRRTTRYFAKNDLSRLIRETLRDAAKPLSTGEITATVAAAKGYPSSALPAINKMVLARLGVLTKRGELTKTGSTRDARWTIAP
jgi:ribosomal protein L29